MWILHLNTHLIPAPSEELIWIEHKNLPSAETSEHHWCLHTISVCASRKNPISIKYRCCTTSILCGSQQSTQQHRREFFEVSWKYNSFLKCLKRLPDKQHLAINSESALSFFMYSSPSAKPCPAEIKSGNSQVSHCHSKREVSCEIVKL